MDVSLDFKSTVKDGEKFVNFFFSFFLRTLYKNLCKSTKKMSKDNVLLTVLGLVGMGALALGISKQEDVQEDYSGGMTSFPFSTRTELVKAVRGQNGCLSALNYADPRPGAQEILQQVEKIAASDASSAQRQLAIAQLSAQQTDKLASSLQQEVNARTAENYQPDRRSLGSNMVTEPYYVSYPQYQQTVPQRSPSLGLGRDVRYNPPSTDRMGITEAYQNLPQNRFTSVSRMPASSSVEHFDMISEHYEPETVVPIKAKGYFANEAGYPGTNVMSNKDEFIKAVATGNATANKKQTTGLIAPLTCNEGCASDAGVSDALIPLGPDGADSNVMVYERSITVPLKSGWRQNSPGVSDYIRGDLAVCVDPCQKGWFQSSLKPSGLTVGALENGSVGSSGVAGQKQAFGGSVVSVASSGGVNINDLTIQASAAGSTVVGVNRF